jgi:hypothetical protein
MDNDGCGQCHSTIEHIPEECPAAVWYDNGPTGGACEAAYLRLPEALAVIARGPGTVDYYRALFEGVDMMHAVGACPL